MNNFFWLSFQKFNNKLEGNATVSGHISAAIKGPMVGV